MKDLKIYNQSTIKKEVDKKKGKVDIILKNSKKGYSYFTLNNFEELKTKINCNKNLNPYPLLSIEKMKELNVGKKIVGGYNMLLNIKNDILIEKK